MDFNYALVRKPGPTFASGLTTADLGIPDFDLATVQHEQYCAALQSCGLNITKLPTLPDFPDSPFVEDTAIITEKCVVITRLGDESRRGEEHSITEIFEKDHDLEVIKSPGTVDGGDVLRVGSHFYVGLSNRTNAEGAAQLIEILSKHGFTSSTIPVTTVLHLKTGVTYIGDNRIIAIDEFATRSEFQKFDVVRVSVEQSYAANCLLINGTLLMAAGFPKVRERLRDLGYPIIEIAMTEFQKMDGGLTCLSLLLT
jgi:dimethylargininase